MGSNNDKRAVDRRSFLKTSTAAAGAAIIKRGRRILDDWPLSLPQFVQVFPRDYKRALAGVEFGDRDY